MRSLLALVLGAVVAVLVAWLAIVLIDNTRLPNWLDIVVVIVAVIAWLVWAFPRYLGNRAV